MSEKIVVHVRVRNKNVKNEKENEPSVWFIKENLLNQRMDDGKSMTYLCYDSIFFHEKNSVVFEKCIKKDVQSLFNGKSLTVFAYGQTGSGKTHTMTGNIDDLGIIGRALQEIFVRKNDEIQCLISYFEIYNENIIDLIKRNNTPRVFFYKNQLILKGIEKVLVDDFESSLELVRECERKRKIGQTQFNLRSSRSHTIFKLELKLKHTVTTMTLIDLAGSEKASGSTLRVKEGVFINKSLLALGKVMNSLHKNEFTTYRESKLTRVLQSSMTGNVTLIALCMISPDSKCIDESISTLKFASRLCQIEMKCKIQSNDELDNQKLICDHCKKEIESQKSKISVDDFSDSSTQDSLPCDSENKEYHEKLVGLQIKRISNLEILIKSLLEKHPSQREKEIFSLEKNMFNLKIELLKKNYKDQQI